MQIKGLPGLILNLNSISYVCVCRKWVRDAAFIIFINLRFFQHDLWFKGICMDFRLSVSISTTQLTLKFCYVMCRDSIEFQFRFFLLLFLFYNLNKCCSCVYETHIKVDKKFVFVHVMGIYMQMRINFIKHIFSVVIDCTVVLSQEKSECCLVIVECFCQILKIKRRFR